MKIDRTKKNKEQKAEKQLMMRYLEGDKDAFQDIVTLYKNQLYAFLRRFLNRDDLIDEVFQETFLQLYRSKDTFDTTKPLRPWLFTIAANKARDLLRKRQRSEAVSLTTMAEPTELSIDDVVNTLQSYEITPHDEAEKAERARQVRHLIANMPENLREILILAYFEQFSYKQMAEILSIPIGTVKSRLHTAVVHFTKKWKAGNGDGKI